LTRPELKSGAAWLASATPEEVDEFLGGLSQNALLSLPWVFEFWALPPWIGDDVEKYADAMVRYCQVSHQKAGAPPDVVGIQNEEPQTAEQFHKMTLVLRRKLDAAGFASVRIHMKTA